MNLRVATCAVFLLLCFSFLTGCNHVSTTAERNTSFAPYAGITIRDAKLGAEISLQGYIALRTALVLVANSAQPSRVGFGSAVAIDSRGYFLTASHCVAGDKTPLQVWRHLPRGRKLTEPISVSEEAEVVWRGDVSKGEPDLAVLHDPRPPDLVFEWAPEIKIGESAVAAGLNYEQPLVASLTSAAAGGKVLGSVEQTTSTPSWLKLTGNLPIHGGDSGGPLAATDGRLLGINYLIGRVLHLTLRPAFLPLGWVSTAARPDLAWLSRLIDEDYAKRPHAAAIAALWRRTDAAEFLSNLLIDRLRDLEATRLAAHAPDDIRADYHRQELLRKILSDEAGIGDPFFVDLREVLPRAVPTEPVSPADVAKVAAVLREKLQMN